jgi:hypothetical protein
LTRYRFFSLKDLAKKKAVIFFFEGPYSISHDRARLPKKNFVEKAGDFREYMKRLLVLGRKRGKN